MAKSKTEIDLDKIIMSGSIKMNKSTSHAINELILLNDVRKDELIGHLLALAMKQNSPYPELSHIKLP